MDRSIEMRASFQFSPDFDRDLAPYFDGVEQFVEGRAESLPTGTILLQATGAQEIARRHLTNYPTHDYWAPTSENNSGLPEYVFVGDGLGKIGEKARWEIYDVTGEIALVLKMTENGIEKEIGYPFPLAINPEDDDFRVNSAHGQRMIRGVNVPLLPLVIAINNEGNVITGRLFEPEPVDPDKIIQRYKQVLGNGDMTSLSEENPIPEKDDREGQPAFVEGKTKTLALDFSDISYDAQAFADDVRNKELTVARWRAAMIGSLKGGYCGYITEAENTEPFRFGWQIGKRKMRQFSTPIAQKIESPDDEYSAWNVKTPYGQMVVKNKNGSNAYQFEIDGINLDSGLIHTGLKDVYDKKLHGKKKLVVSVSVDDKEVFVFDKHTAMIVPQYEILTEIAMSAEYVDTETGEAQKVDITPEAIGELLFGVFERKAQPQAPVEQPAPYVSRESDMSRGDKRNSNRDDRSHDTPPGTKGRWKNAGKRTRTRLKEERRRSGRSDNRHDRNY
jgi:hypothetical protein